LRRNCDGNAASVDGRRRERVEHGQDYAGQRKDARRKGLYFGSRAPISGHRVCPGGREICKTACVMHVISIYMYVHTDM
jgi:hypothetical protein